MKRLNQKTNSAIAKTLATSVLFASCTPHVDIEQMSNVGNNEPDLGLQKSKGVSISLSLSEETKQSLLKIAPLVQEIIDNPAVAQELSNNPRAFCINRGYDFILDLDEPVFKVIVALGNSDINNALKDNDFEKFMQLCAEMNLLEENQKVKLNSIFKNEEEQEIFNSIAKQLNGETIETRSVAFWLAITVAVVVAIVLSYTVGLEEDAAPQDTSGGEQGTNNVDSLTANLSEKSQVFLHYSNPNYSILDVWALKNKKISSYQLVSGYKKFLAEQIVSYLKENKPTLFDKFSEVQILEFIKRNMIL